jgi:hypothetical protein
VAINASAHPQPAPGSGALVVATDEHALERGRLAPHAGVILRQ